MKDEAGVTSKADLATTLDPALVDRNGRAVVPDARGKVTLASRRPDDETDDTKAVGGNGILTKGAATAITAVYIERVGGED